MRPQDRIYRRRSEAEHAADATLSASDIADAADTWRRDAPPSARNWLDAPAVVQPPEPPPSADVPPLGV